MDIAENKSGELITADQAEGKVIEEVEKLDQELLRGWVLKCQEKAISLDRAQVFIRLTGLLITKFRCFVMVVNAISSQGIGFLSSSELDYKAG